MCKNSATYKNGLGEALGSGLRVTVSGACSLWGLQWGFLRSRPVRMFPLNLAQKDFEVLSGSPDTAKMRQLL